jgi:hypothetical protein
MLVKQGPALCAAPEVASKGKVNNGASIGGPGKSVAMSPTFPWHA